MKVLNKRQVLLLHQHLVKETGGSLGLRDEDKWISISMNFKTPNVIKNGEIFLGDKYIVKGPSVRPLF